MSVFWRAARKDGALRIAPCPRAAPAHAMPKLWTPTLSATLREW